MNNPVPLWTPFGELTDVPQKTAPCRAHANDNLPPIVAFTGLAGAGKTTASRYLVERHGYKVVKFAGPLKDMCRAVGLSESQIEGDLKEVPSDDLCGKSPRQFMQLLGTQFARDLIGSDFWIGLWLRRARDVLDQGNRVVTDDCRFSNEAAAILRLGGDIITIAGRGGIAGSHESESGIGTDLDAVLANNGSINDLHSKIEEVIRRWG